MTDTRSILITGSSSGIGFEAARQLKARGWRVLATARKADDRSRLEKDLGVETIGLELSDMASVRAAARQPTRPAVRAPQPRTCVDVDLYESSWASPKFSAHCWCTDRHDIAPTEEGSRYVVISDTILANASNAYWRISSSVRS